jgi:mannose-6-phosphate isomerase
LAEILRARDPKNYPDDNHKPEMVIAINDLQVCVLPSSIVGLGANGLDGLWVLQVMCGFRPIPEIASFIQTNEHLKKAVGAAGIFNSISLFY